MKKDVKEKIPEYILIYYIYEIVYAVFWFVMDMFFPKDMIGLYILTTIIAAGLIGIMLYRSFVKNDEKVKLLVVIANIMVLSTISKL